ncbi:hypothetical protein WJ50_12765 [Burkholderia ubonensis]|nr:hypothetical protein WJ49_22630 [Burkholderia ubonensis]KVL73176.1 hypothetical protein WJ48_00325 [Burkholderia ubonensis]KVL91004.1 hypothetical protein WJ50_12765 [Burkholderia ubonensis]
MLERGRRIWRVDHLIVGKALATGVACGMVERAAAGCLVGAMYGSTDQLPAVFVIEAENPAAWIRPKPPYAVESRIRRAEFHFDRCYAHILVLHSSPHGFAVEETRLTRDHFAIADQA